MAVDFDLFAVLFLLLPFFAAAIAVPVTRATGSYAGWLFALVPLALFINFAGMIPAVAGGTPVTYSLDWVPALDLRLVFHIDGLSLTFALLINGIGTFILIYSGAYLKGDPGLGRFFAFMLLFLGAMLGLVLADSLPALFAFWELTAVASYLLIGYDRTRERARRAAFQALLITGIGGLSLMAGGVLLHLVSGTWLMSELSSSPTIRAAVWSYPWVVGFILVASFTKSAQVPFHFWLPNAMEAPTPVSAFLHSATMVQAGIYLLARLSPILSGSALWQGWLCGIGGLTLLWGALMALKQTDLKQMLAQSTIASLGLMVMLLGFATPGAYLAVAAYFVAHALYKAGLFLTTGMLDHGTGTRDLTRLGGLRDELTITFICAALAAISMFGVPPFLGWFAKEEVYLSLATNSAVAWLSIAVLLLGNAMLGAIALAFLIRPFFGRQQPPSDKVHEAGFSLWIGPALFGLVGLAVAFVVGTYGDQIVGPMATAINGRSVAAHLGFAVDLAALPIWLSVGTWALASLIYWQLDVIRSILRQMEQSFRWSFDQGFDQLVFGLVRLAGAWTRLFHHGQLELYVTLVFAIAAISLLLPMTLLGGWPALPHAAMPTFYEAGILILAAAGVATVVAARTRLFAILALGIQGLAIALIFLMFGAPDLAFTQLMIEVISAVILALVMTRLRLAAHDPRPPTDWLRDGALAIICGVALTAVLLRVLQGTLDGRLSDFFIKNSVAIAHGHNIVNVILVDFRGLDTLGEISVVMTAGIAILALLSRQHKRKGDGA